MDDQQVLFLQRAIRAITSHLACRDHADIAQEIWIEAIGLDRAWNPKLGVPWKTYMGRYLHRRAVDVIRRIGDYVQRTGKRRRIPQIPFSIFEQDHNGKKHTFDSVDRYGKDELDAVDWADLCERVSREPKPVRVAFLYVCGLTMREVGERFGLCESRVSQILTKTGAKSYDRIAELIFESSGNDTGRENEH